MATTCDLTFEALVERYRQSLAAAAYHLCGNADAAQDIVQETLVDAYRGFGTLREPGKAAAWLFAILRWRARLAAGAPGLKLEDGRHPYWETVTPDGRHLTVLPTPGRQ